MANWKHIFGSLLEARTGIRLSDSIRDRVEGVLQARSDTLGYDDIETYLRQLESQPDSTELQTLTNLITVGKTSFNRYPKQVSALIDVIMPVLDKIVAPGETIGIWSAGCSTGEEPYTVAMALSHAGWFARRRFRLFATDINTSSIEHARAATYPYTDWHTLPKPLASYCVESSTGGIEVSSQIRQRIRFEHLNLIEDEIPDHGGWHVVICANVLIYFSRRNVERTVERLVDAMAPTGLLMLGGSESLNSFEIARPLGLMKVQDCYAYGKGDWSVHLGPFLSERHTAVSETLPVQPASRRQPRETAPRPQFQAETRIAQALALAERGDRGAAIVMLENLKDLDNAITINRTLGLLYFNERRFRDAGFCFKEAILGDPLAFELYFYLGRLHAALNERHVAIEALRRALFLEPGFSFARYELARMLHLDQDYSLAIREYQRAERSAIDPHIQRRLQQHSAGTNETYWFDSSFIVELCVANRERAEREAPPVASKGFGDGP